MKILAATLLAATLGLHPAAVLAQAQGDQCWSTPDDGTQTTYFNPQATDNWRVSVQQKNLDLMNTLIGVYYGDIYSGTGMVAHEWLSFEPQGLFRYQTQTCSSTGCSPNQGAGAWTGHRQADGSVYIMVNFTDMVRASQCFSITAMFQQDGYRAADGSFWRRVQ